MKIRLLLAFTLLVTAFTIPTAADPGGNNCSFTCSTGWSGQAWAKNADTCAAGCRAMCVTCTSWEFTGGTDMND